METRVLETIIYGRVEPHIYAFRTEKVPHYTKVGDTYRPTEIRIKEWERIIGRQLTKIFDEPAFADSLGDVYFRDYSVHSYLEDRKGKHRLTRQDPEGNPWFSNEFFLETGREDVEEAVQDIVESYSNGNPRDYDFYNTVDKSHKEIIERLNLDYKPRSNQQDVIDRFCERYDNIGRNKLNLLMYAVMRFGKSFTALQCALKMNSKLVIVVSAKTDVKSSWKSTLYEHRDFNNYTFIDSQKLKEPNFSLKEEIASGKQFVLFLSLQDLSGKDVKEKHKQLFKLKEPSTLLIVDETHFGARASEYGQVLRGTNTEDTIRKEDLGDTETADKLDVIKNFENVRVRIHLSGTPYRILMDGEFKDNDIIAFVQYGDIVKAQKEWDKEHFAQDNSNSEEWDNPYYGFPEMIRFAFHPNQDSIDLINEMKRKGAGGLSELFSPESVDKMESPSFKHKDLVLGFVKAIDGTKEDANIFPFLNYGRIQKGEMCHHMVWVLPFQSSCDAMEQLLKNFDFKRLSARTDTNPKGYEVINISGYNCPKCYSTPDKVRTAIEEFENKGVKTITLTVQRMLTGSTIPEWDTMLFMKDTSSPQEYDQATFRIQNPFVKTIVQKGKNGSERKIKINLKPQTLLVDFDPARMFRMQEAKSEFYQGDDANGNNDLKERIKEDLEISPIIYIKEDKLVRVEANSIIKAVREYSKSRSVLDEASLIPSDSALLDDKNIRVVIGALDALNNKKGLEFNPFEGDGTALEGLPKLLKSLKEKNKTTKKGDEKLSEEEILRRKLKTFYASILMFAFLSDSDIKYLDDIIETLSNKNEDDIRIANNLGINVHILEIVRDKASQNARHQLDNRIENIHDLMQGTDGEVNKAKIALTKFERLSASEIVTPQSIIDVLINGISDNMVKGYNPLFIDVASKQGELTIAFLQKYPLVNKNNIYSVATSTVAYEMTRKVYKALGIPVRNVMLPPNGGDNYYNDLYDLIISTIGNKTPNIVFCCPPFQKPKGGGRGDGGADIYPCYFCLCKRLNPNNSEDSNIPYMFGMYTKATWNTHSTTFIPGTEYDSEEEEEEDECGEIKIPDFRKMMLSDRHIVQLNDYLNAKPFYSKNQKVTLRGGVNIFFWDNQPRDNVRVSLNVDCNHHILEEDRCLIPDYLKELLRNNGIVDNNVPDYPYVRIGGLGLSILRKVLEKALAEHHTFIRVRPRNIFKITENIEKNYSGKPKAADGVKVYVQKGNWMYINKSVVKGYEAQSNLVDSWKVVAAKGSSGEDIFPHAIISQPRVIEAGAVCSDTYLVIKSFTGENAEQNARAFAGYMKTEFFRFMMLLAKNDQNLTRHCYRFVPDIPSEHYSDPYSYFSIEPSEQEFISKFIKKWESEDTEGICLNTD